MKSFLFGALVIGVAIASSSQVWARGGGRAGGGRPESREGGERFERRTGATENRPAGDEHRAAEHNQVSQLRTNHAPENRPFTTGWYGSHPGAWQATRGYGDAWAAASFASAAGWLGLDDYADDGAASDDSANTADTSADTATDVADSGDGQEQESTSDPAAATQLAQSGAANVPAEADFLPLGVYALAPDGQKESTAMVQIAVSKQGVVRGSYYDLVSDQGHAISGAIDKKTRRVAFTIGSKGKTVFETQLADLTQPSGELSVHFPDGQASDWSVARFEDTEEPKN
ncbi:MAG TPA: hypothetical protein VHV08_11600 [Pirellulales bacterium]|nr:hypothetical protein [Pirellulales bacterium]